MGFTSISSLIAFVCYSLATVMILSRLFHPKGNNNIMTMTFASVAILAHGTATFMLLFANEHLNFSLPNVVSLVCLLIAFAMTLATIHFKVKLLLPVIYGFAGLWQCAMIFISPINHTMVINASTPVLIHISFALSAYCILVIATFFAAQVTYINMKLKSKNLMVVHQLPPLMQVERQLFIILFIGSIALLFSEILGFIYLEGLISKQYAHKTVLSLLACALYFITLWGHFKHGWRGHRILTLTSVATFLLTLGYFGSRFVKEFLLS